MAKRSSTPVTAKEKASARARRKKEDSIFIENELLQYEKTKKTTPRYMQEKRKMILNDIKLTDKQKILVDLIDKNKIITITGFPGTSKTFSSCYSALKLLSEGKVDKIYLTTPIVTTGDSLGFLKGSLAEKTAEYLQRFIANFEQIIDSKILGDLFNNNIIQFEPVQFMRGANFSNCVLIADEVQNFDYSEIMTIITRMNKNCKIILAGDKKQNDINKKMVSIDFVKELLDGIPETAQFEFERGDIQRDPILIMITDKFEEMEAAGKLPNTKNKN